MKLASKGDLAEILGNQPYECRFDWPEDCSVQCGDSGIVFTKNGNYHTAFFEAFPNEPNVCIRGEGETIELAEQDAWNQFIRMSSCESHEFERRGYKNGSGFCKHCDLFQVNVFEPTESCAICSQPTYWKSDKNGVYYCKDHADQIPEEKRRKKITSIFDILIDEK